MFAERAKFAISSLGLLLLLAAHAQLTLAGASQHDAPNANGRTASVRGQVLRAGDNVPLRRAQVTLLDRRGPAYGLHTVISDDNGRFELSGLPSSRYGISASKTGYLRAELGQRDPLDIPLVIDLKEGETRQNVRLTLQVAGIISGVVFDEAGDGLSGAKVSVGRVQFRDWDERFDQIASAQTDSSGGFRIYDLSPGRYRLWVTTSSSVVPGDQNRLGYLRTYYPGVASPRDSLLLDVSAGARLTTITVTALRGVTGDVRAVVRNPDGSLSSDARVTLRSLSDDGSASTAGLSILSSAGSVLFRGISAGEYRITAESPLGQATGSVAVSDHSGTDVVLNLGPGVRLRGRIRFQGQQSSTKADGVRMTAVSLDGTASGSRPNIYPDGTFEWTGIFSTSFLVRASLPGWTLRAVSDGGRDVTDDGIDVAGRRSLDDVDVILTPETPQVSGTVVGADGLPAPGATVVIFADDPGKWRRGSRYVKRVLADGVGAFVLSGLPPSRYVLIATGPMATGAETNRDLLSKWRAIGRQLTITEGTGSQAVQLRGGRP